MAQAGNTHHRGRSARTKDSRHDAAGEPPDGQVARVTAGRRGAGGLAIAGERAARGQPRNPRTGSPPADPGSEPPAPMTLRLPAGRPSGRPAVTTAEPGPADQHPGPRHAGRSLDSYISDLIDSAPALTHQQRDTLALLLRTRPAASAARTARGAQAATFRPAGLILAGILTPHTAPSPRQRT
jgi:hypothetical protein